MDRPIDGSIDRLRHGIRDHEFRDHQFHVGHLRKDSNAISTAIFLLLMFVNVFVGDLPVVHPYEAIMMHETQFVKI